MDNTWKPEETNLNGLTWPLWFKAAGYKCYSVDALYSPVLIRNEKLFYAWRMGIDPVEYIDKDTTYPHWNRM